MDETRRVHSIDDFTDLAVASGLVGAESMRALRDEFERDAGCISKFGRTITAFCVFLVSSGALTCWQCDMLRRGRHKGFFLDDYRLLDRLGDDETNIHCLAQRASDGSLVDLAIARPGFETRQDSELHYEVRGVIYRSSPPSSTRTSTPDSSGA